MKNHKKDNETRKSMQELSKFERKIDQRKQQIQCACQHSVMGVMTLTSVPTGNGKQYRCTLCNKTVDIKSVDETRFNDARRVIDTVCDHLKIQCNGASKGDRKLVEKIAQTQYAVSQLGQMFEASKNQMNKRNDKNNDRNKNRNRNSDARFA